MNIKSNIIPTVHCFVNGDTNRVTIYPLKTKWTSGSPFETDAFVICSFVPRLYDYHPDAIPAPYNHSNIDSDEVLYYVDGDFMSRNDIEAGHISVHPAGIPHGPHPGAMERSIGKKDTQELAVMVDTFKPLQVTEEALKIADEDYYKSWLE